jgi:tRNA-dihydrouridine synthase A
MINRKISVAPMMAYTDRHFRVLLRLMSPSSLLYTEMVTAHALMRGDIQKLLGYSPEEHPLALQVGGSDPEMLDKSAKLAESFGYDEINLNVGCPSDRVQSGQFGACLMKDPELVARCVSAMREATHIPVSVKTRIGVDDLDSYEHLHHFISRIANEGCEIFIIHARKAWLSGLSPKENREIPPLLYPMVYQLKQDFPNLHISINGGVRTIDDIQTHLKHVDGVMIGRQAYADPYLFFSIENEIFGADIQRSREKIVEAYLPYVAAQLGEGVPLRSLIRHLFGLFQGQSGGKKWRRYLTENAGKNNINVIEKALDILVFSRHPERSEGSPDSGSA